MVLTSILVVALAVAPANALIAPLAQAPRLAPRRQSRRGEDCLLSPRVPPVVATFRYSKSEREVLENVECYIEVQTPLYSLQASPKRFHPTPPRYLAERAARPSQSPTIHDIDALSSFDKPVVLCPGNEKGTSAEGGATAHLPDPAHRAGLCLPYQHPMRDSYDGPYQHPKRDSYDGHMRSAQAGLRASKWVFLVGDEEDRACREAQSRDRICFKRPYTVNVERSRRTSSSRSFSHFKHKNSPLFYLYFPRSL